MAEVEFPKMVYPKGNNVAHVNAGSPGVGEFAGVIVNNEDEEKWVMKGNKLEDFGKPKAAEAPAADWGKSH